MFPWYPVGLVAGVSLAAPFPPNLGCAILEIVGNPLEGGFPTKTWSFAPFCPQNRISAQPQEPSPVQVKIISHLASSDFGLESHVQTEQKAELLFYTVLHGFQNL